VRRGTYGDYVVVREETRGERMRPTLKPARPPQESPQKSIRVRSQRCYPASPPPANELTARSEGSAEIIEDTADRFTTDANTKNFTLSQRSRTAWRRKKMGSSRSRRTSSRTVVGDAVHRRAYGVGRKRRGKVYRTNDGGRLWAEVPIYARGRILGIAFLDWNHGWVMAKGAADDNSATVDLFLTTDGGRRWRQRTLPRVDKIYRADRLRGWAIGPHSMLVRTEDGGRDVAPCRNAARC
jgi:photosystem II stability/assembly factor-like uncharacterized protein